MDNRGVRSRTNSTSSVRSPAQPATPSHTPNAAFARLPPHNLSPDQLAAGLSRIRTERGGSRSSSIPATPAPTPNPLLHVTYHMYPEQLAAGISNLKADEGYVDSTSFPATPAPSPFSPSPAQSVSFTPDQVAEGIQRLKCEEEGGVSDDSTDQQPPTPSTTPGDVLNHPLMAGGGQALQQQQQQQLGVIPEHLAASISHLRGDEGMESGSNPSTPVATPISPSPASNAAAGRPQLIPEQLAAGIHRLKVEEGMSSGGSSGFPSTPAPTPFIHHPGGVRPEDLAAGISRLSVIEEGVVIKEADSGSSEPDLSQYFGDASGDAGHLSKENISSVFDNSQESFFEQQLQDESTHDAMLHSCRESRVDLTRLETSAAATMSSKSSGAQIEIAEQQYDDAQSLQHRHCSESDKSHHASGVEDYQREEEAKEEPEPSVCTIFGDAKDDNDPFDTIGIQAQEVKEVKTDTEALKVPTALEIVAAPQQDMEVSAASTQYSTPIAPTPTEQQLGYSTYMTSPPANVSGYRGVEQLQQQQPITSPLPNSAVLPTASPMLLSSQFSTSSSIDDGLVLPEQAETLPDAESMRRHHAWIPCAATGQILQGVAASTPGSFFPDRSCLTMPGVVVREELTDPIRPLVAHYRGDSEAVKRQVMTADSVTQDQRGLRELVKAGCFRAAVNLTARLLQMYNQGPGQGGSLSKHTPSSLQIWFSRIALLVKLRQFSVAEVESEPFGDLDRPDLYFQFYPEMYPKKQGSMVPFGFRLLIAELPQYLGKANETLDHLYALLRKVHKILSNLESGRSENGSLIPPLSEEDRLESLALWRSREVRVLYSLANCAILLKDFELSVTNLNILLEKESDEAKPKILSAIGRVFLQLGDVESAQICFSKAYKLRQNDGSESLQDVACLSIANNDYETALASLQKANDASPGNPSVVNNIAVCFLYLGRLKEGLAYLESSIMANPDVMLQETPILNLCTLYELESSYAGQKKRALLDLVSQFKGDGINASCLKLQM